MANPENLRPPFTPSEARDMGRKGGLAAGEAKRKKKDLREALKCLLEMEDKDGATGADKLAFVLLEKALSGDVRAFSELRDTVYGKPVNTVEMTGKDGAPLQPPALEVVFTNEKKD